MEPKSGDDIPNQIIREGGRDKDLEGKRRTREEEERAGREGWERKDGGETKKHESTVQVGGEDPNRDDDG